MNTSPSSSTIYQRLPNPDVDPEMQDLDLERRRELRSFLMGCRSLLAPTELGLPRTGRRRVPGLRRGEVAELIGVTVDWYRRFECGQPVRVSPKFLWRLIGALRLTECDALLLYRLAIPEMYFTAHDNEIPNETLNVAFA